MVARLSPLIFPKGVTGPAPFRQMDWPLTPWPTPEVNIKSWTWKYNPNLIAQDKMNVGEQVTDLPPRPYPPPGATWLWSYNLNLIGQDRFPPGAVFTERPSRQRQWLQPKNLSTWTWQYNLNLIGQDQLPTGEARTELTVKPYEYHVQLRTWAWSYNLNLIGQDKLPTGEIITDRPLLTPIQLQTWLNTTSLSLTTVVAGTPFAQYDWPLPASFAYPVGLRTWSQPVITTVAVTYKPATVLEWGTPIPTPAGQQAWISAVNLPLTTTVAAQPFAQDDWPNPPRISYQVGFTASFNLNLIGQDKLPTGEAVTDRPSISPTQLQTWISTVNIALTTAVAPFVQDDWPLSIGPRPIQSFTASFNLNLIGQDQLPTGEVVTDLPPRAPQQPTPIFVASYNKNLISQDQLPTGKAVTDRPPLAPLSSIQLLTWIQSVNLALTTQAAVLPFNQYSWPINTGPQQPIQVFTASYNQNLIGQDKLPFRQQDWPLPTPRPRSLDLVTWIDRAKSYLQRPQRQTDWPIPRAPQQPIQTFTASFNRNLIGKDRLPFRQQDWPVPRDARQPNDHGFREFVSSLNLALKFPPFSGLLPRNQYSWPLPQQPAPMTSRYSWVSDTQNFYPIYVSPIPPVPPPTPPEDNRLAYNAGNEWQMLDRIKEPGPVGWR